MKYSVQKIIMENAIVYNFLYGSELIGHLVEMEDSKVLVQSSSTAIIPIAEAFGIDGPVWMVENEEYKLKILTASPEFQPIYEFKVINLSDNFLTESEI